MLGKHCGRHQFRQRLKELGFRLTDKEVDALFFGPFKELADRKKEVFDEDIVALVESEAVTRPRRGACAASGRHGDRRHGRPPPSNSRS